MQLFFEQDILLLTKVFSAESRKKEETSVGKKGHGPKRGTKMD